MMGRQPGGQDHLFYSFNLESVVPEKHLLRGIDRCLDLTDLRQHLAEYYSHTGRPSIDPELMIRMLVVGYCYGIRSERRLCEEVTPESGLPLVLPSESGRCRAEPFHLLKESPWAVS
jgi:hypothetical protein